VVERGRLKLREHLDGGSELIYYERPQSPAVRESRYHRVAVSPEAAGLLRATLRHVAVVEKTRRLFVWRSVRIHLDSVDGLGSFLELEAVATPGSDLAEERVAVDHLRRVLEIRDEDLVGEGYAELGRRRRR